jgi:N-acetylglucosaminyldiphosphoundecaprenol N-acetyl-beta-D-mannosaminyltransferase
MSSQRDITSIAFAPLTQEEALTEVGRLVSDRAGASVCFCEGNLYSSARAQPAVVEALADATLVFADGMSVFWLARLTGRTVPERVPGPSFLLSACEYGVAAGWRHYFLGGEEGVADALAARLCEQFPGLQVAGTACPPFRDLTEEEEAELLARIEAAEPDLLWVGLGGPKQELWMARQRGRLRVPIMLGVGAAFDFHSQNRPWAPAWVRRLGLEWLFRMLTGGFRTFCRNVRCVATMAGLVLSAAVSAPWRR